MLYWLMNIDFAGGDGTVVTPTLHGKSFHGRNRVRYIWWLVAFIPRLFS